MGDGGSGNTAHWAGRYGDAPATVVSSPTPGVEGGRVGKPARRRSRASRRSPVTLLNTDTSNFRAMVQQFTGVPSGPVISFGAGEYGHGAVPVRPSPTSAVMSLDHYQLAASSSSQHRPTSMQGQLFRPQPLPQQYGYDQQSGIQGGGDVSPFLHGFDSSAAEDRMLLQSIQAAQMMPASRPASTNNTNGYNFVG